jgi:hypothetical protein
MDLIIKPLLNPEFENVKQMSRFWASSRMLLFFVSFQDGEGGVSSLPTEHLSNASCKAGVFCNNALENTALGY